MCEKNTTPERKSVRVSASASTSSLAKESSKKPAPEMERMMSDEGLKREHREMEVNDSKKLISAVEEKISEAEGVKKLMFVFMFIKFTFLISFSKNVQFLLIM